MYRYFGDCCNHKGSCILFKSFNYCSWDQLLEFHTSFYETISNEFLVHGNFKHTQFSQEYWYWRDSNLQLLALEASSVLFELTWLINIALWQLIGCSWCVILKGTISDGPFQTSLFFPNLSQFFCIFRENSTILTYLYNDSLRNSVFWGRETTLCCWELIYY